ncbi:DUF1684 domain-containing protein [Paeniglutamicibacter antarcticus]|uniref:DUF1684 domain-containing protein n=2 Tax=Arthrobacter terrae TaxID=2935737 RepID=A0A931CPQ2_9MICC|nr:DUF1684 domain-containing protein [Arthrobacter terrae]
MCDTDSPTVLPTTGTGTTRQDWERFRLNRNAALSDGHGWLSLTSLQWLSAEAAELRLFPGLWSADNGWAADKEGNTDDGAATLWAEPGDGLLFADSQLPASGTLTATLADEESLLWVQHGSTIAELARRGGRYLVRTRDSQSPVLQAFHGVPVFDFRADLVLPGRFEPYPGPRVVNRTTANETVSASTEIVGELVFELDGHDHRLLAEDGGSGALDVTFHDATNHRSTAGWRKLTVPRPSGTAVVLDFNKSMNYPSAFTAFGTCPMPVQGNRLDAPIEAGEKAPDSDDR